MSIASEITRLSSAKAALKDAIVAKGVEVADSLKLDGYAEKVAAIPTGTDWGKPQDWPDIKAILENDDPVKDGLTDHNYANKLIILFDKDFGSAFNCVGGQAYRTHEGEFFTQSGIHYMINPNETDYKWMIIYSDGNIADGNDKFIFPVLPDGTLGNRDNWSLRHLWICGSGRDSCVVVNNDYYNTMIYGAMRMRRLENLTYRRTKTGAGSYGLNAAIGLSVENVAFEYAEGATINGFNGCSFVNNSGCAMEGVAYKGCRFSTEAFTQNFKGSFGYQTTILKVDVDLSVSKPTNCYDLFCKCANLLEFPPLDLSDCTEISYAFCDCYSAKKFNSVLDLRSLTASPHDNTFRGLNALLEFPVIYSNVSLYFNFFALGLKKETFAKFDENMNVIGGFVYTINSVSERKTLRFNNNFKNKFSEDEKAAIASALSEKGWDLNW